LSFHNAVSLDERLFVSPPRNRVTFE
jgi:hypothetical protein